MTRIEMKESQNCRKTTTVKPDTRWFSGICAFGYFAAVLKHERVVAARTLQVVVAGAAHPVLRLPNALVDAPDLGEQQAVPLLLVVAAIR